MNFCVGWVRGLQLLSSCLLVAQSCQTCWDPMDCSPPGSSAHTGAACQFLRGGGGGVVPARGLNPRLLHCWQILNQLSHQGSSGGPSEREPAYQCRRGERGRFHPWVGKIPWRGKGNPPQYSCLENFMDRGAWWATVHGVSKSQTRLRGLTQATKTPYAMHSLARKKGGGVMIKVKVHYV